MVFICLFYLLFASLNRHDIAIITKSTGYDYLDEFLAREYCVLCRPFMYAK